MGHGIATYWNYLRWLGSPGTAAGYERRVGLLSAEAEAVNSPEETNKNCQHSPGWNEWSLLVDTVSCKKHHAAFMFNKIVACG